MTPRSWECGTEAVFPQKTGKEPLEPLTGRSPPLTRGEEPPPQHPLPISKGSPAPGSHPKGMWDPWGVLEKTKQSQRHSTGGGLASSKPGRAQGCTAGGSDTHTAPSRGAEPRHGSGGALWEPRKPPRSLSRGVLAAPSAHTRWQWLNWGSKRVGSRAHVGRPASREMRDGENLGRFKLLLTPRSS